LKIVTNKKATMNAARKAATVLVSLDLEGCRLDRFDMKESATSASSARTERA
jgi:hypothetical protein